MPEVQSAGDFVLISLSVRSWAGTVSFPTENPLVRVQYQLLKKEALAGVNSAVSAAYRCLDGLSLQFKVRGVRCLPVAHVQEAEAALAEARTTLDAAVDALLTNYETSAREAWEALPEKARASMRTQSSTYPTPEEIRKRFHIQYSVFSVGDAPVPLSGALDVNQMLDEFRVDAADALVSGYMDQLDAMRHRLTEGSRLHVSSIDKFSDFLSHFEALASTVSGPMTANMLNEVRKLVTETRSIMSGITPVNLKEDKNLRAATGQALQAVFDEAVRYTSALGVAGRRRLQED